MKKKKRKRKMEIQEVITALTFDREALFLFHIAAF